MESVAQTFGRLAASATQPPPPTRRGAASEPRERAGTPLVGYIRNPRSHRNKGRDAATEGRTDILLAEPRTRAELEDALARFAAAGIDLLAVSGGDGTIRDVLTRGAPLFGGKWPLLAVLPQGKTNALALDLGVSPGWTIDDAIAAACASRMVTRRAIVVSDREGNQRDRWGFIFGAGVFNAAIDAGQVAHRYGAFQSFAVGVTAAVGLTQAIFGFGRTPWRGSFRMTFADAGTGRPLVHGPFGDSGHRYMAGFTTLRRFPLGIKLLAGAEDEGPIGYFLIDAPRRRAMASVPFAAMGWHGPQLDRLGLHRGGGSAFDATVEDGFILDGERFAGGDLRICAGPELRFVVP